MENFNKTHTSIKHWLADDRPREKMISKGPDSLSTVELLAILLGNGTRSRSAIDLARELLQHCDNSLHMLTRMSLKDIQKIKGIGPAKAVSIKAALQLSVLREQEKIAEGMVIRQSADVANFLQQKIGNESKEYFVVLYLNRRMKLVTAETLSIGGTAGTVVDPKVLMRRAIEEQASYLILSHNHPSGSTRPSEADRNLTKKIKEAAGLLDIVVMDHLIVTANQYYSFADEGIL